MTPILKKWLIALGVLIIIILGAYLAGVRVAIVPVSSVNTEYVPSGLDQAAGVGGVAVPLGKGGGGSVGVTGGLGSVSGGGGKTFTGKSVGGDGGGFVVVFTFGGSSSASKGSSGGYGATEAPSWALPGNSSSGGGETTGTRIKKLPSVIIYKTN